MREENQSYLLDGHLLETIPSDRRRVSGKPQKKHGGDWFTIEVTGELLTGSEKYLVKYDPGERVCWGTNCGINPKNNKPYFADREPFTVLVDNLLFERK